MELSISISINTALHCTALEKRKIRTSFKTLVSKKETVWCLKKSHSNDKLLENITSSSYNMEQKTFIEASCIYNIHTGKKFFCSCYFWRFSFRFTQIKKLEVYFGLYQSSFTFIEKRKPNKYCFMWSKFNFLHVSIYFDGPNCEFSSKNTSSRPEVFLGKGVLKICSKLTGEHPW